MDAAWFKRLVVMAGKIESKVTDVAYFLGVGACIDRATSETC